MLAIYRKSKHTFFPFSDHFVCSSAILILSRRVYPVSTLNSRKKQKLFGIPSLGTVDIKWYVVLWFILSDAPFIDSKSKIKMFRTTACARGCEFRWSPILLVDWLWVNYFINIEWSKYYDMHFRLVQVCKWIGSTDFSIFGGICRFLCRFRWTTDNQLFVRSYFTRIDM